MQIVSENEVEDRGGVKYLIRGPQIDWGVITLQPNDVKPAHFHERVNETFYVTEGVITFILGDQKVEVPAGTAIRLEATEPHGLENNGSIPAKLVFIKESYLPQDKVNCD